METMKVNELMVPVDEFPRISHSATFMEAVFALEAAQEKFLSGESGQRILLVVDDQKEVIGKISPIDLFVGLETNYTKVNAEETIKRYGFKYIWKSMQEDYRLWENPFKDLCQKAADVRIRDFYKSPSGGQMVKADDPLAKCFHLFVMHRHDSLFVTQGDEIIGLLRFSDVYRRVSDSMKACGI